MLYKSNKAMLPMYMMTIQRKQKKDLRCQDNRQLHQSQRLNWIKKTTKETIYPGYTSSCQKKKAQKQIANMH